MKRLIIATSAVMLLSQVCHADNLPTRLVGSFNVDPSQCRTNYNNKYDKVIGVLGISYAEKNHVDVSLSKEGAKDVLYIRDSGSERTLPLSGDGYDSKYYAQAKYNVSEGLFDFQAKGKELSSCSVESNIGLSYPCIKRWDDRVALSLSEAGDLIIRWSVDGQKNGICQLKRLR